MPAYTRWEKLQLKAVTAYAGAVMAPAPQRTYYDLFEATVRHVRQVAQQVRRITLTAPRIAQARTNGPDEYFGLIVPGASGDLHLPAPKMNVRAAIAAMPEADRPDLRWYTIRELRTAAAELDFDVVLHGDSGPGSAWAVRAEPGMPVGVRQGTATYAPPQAGARLLIGDETAAPAIGAILTQGPLPEGSRVLVETPDADHLSPLPDVPGLSVLTRGADVPGSALTTALARVDTTDLAYAWVCGEQSLATGIRRTLVKERGVDRKSVLFSGYWKLGSPRF